MNDDNPMEHQDTFADKVAKAAILIVVFAVVFATVYITRH